MISLTIAFVDFGEDADIAVQASVLRSLYAFRHPIT